MTYSRFLAGKLKKYLSNNYSILLLGPRQVGKSTLIETLLKTIKKKSIIYKLQEYNTFEELGKSPGLLESRINRELDKNKELVLFIDEIQKLPILLDSCQHLIDTYKKRLAVIVTGSSARKLKAKGVNLLPGRVIVEHMHSLMFPEIFKQNEQNIIPLKFESASKRIPDLNSMLLFGTLPGILNEKMFKEKIIQSYVSTYLEEEIKNEALTRNLGNFSKFLELVGLSSGNVVNLTNVSIDTGIPLNTIKSYFQILEDTLVTFSIPAFTKKIKKQILSTPKYIFFDVGVRNAICKFTESEAILKTDESGRIFEHFIILELIKRIKYQHPNWKYFYWRTNNGLEVDFIIQTEDEIIPIEIKYSITPKNEHIKHLKIFMEEYKCKRGFVVGLFKHVYKLENNILAVPWHEI